MLTLQGETALHCAAEGGCLEVVKCLLESIDDLSLRRAMVNREDKVSVRWFHVVSKVE